MFNPNRNGQFAKFPITLIISSFESTRFSKKKKNCGNVLIKIPLESTFYEPKEVSYVINTKHQGM